MYVDMMDTCIHMCVIDAPVDKIYMLCLFSARPFESAATREETARIYYLLNFGALGTMANKRTSDVSLEQRFL